MFAVVYFHGRDKFASTDEISKNIEFRHTLALEKDLSNIVVRQSVKRFDRTELLKKKSVFAFEFSSIETNQNLRATDPTSSNDKAYFEARNELKDKDIFDEVFRRPGNNQRWSDRWFDTSNNRFR